MHTRDILNQRSSHPLASKDSGDHYDNDGDKFDVSQKERVKIDNTKATNDDVRDKHHVCCIDLQVKIMTHTQATLLLHCQGAGLIKIETPCSIMERGCFMTARALKEIIPGKLYYVYNEN